jgi:signal transduction histidine kinase
MKIGRKITLKFNFIVSVILILFALSVYYAFSRYREEEFYTRLREEANTTAKLYSDVEEVTYEVLKKIDQISENVLFGEKVLIYDLNNQLLYSNQEIDIDEIPHSQLERLKEEKEVRYKDGDHEAYGVYFTGKYDELLVFALAYDQYGLSKLRFLKYILITGVFLVTLLSTVLGFIFSRQALSPISQVISQVDLITVSNLNLRVDEGNGKDEIAQLAIKFNKMLERLEAAFAMQRSFVENASHELRTPLTAITGQLEVAMMNHHLSEESRATLRSVLDDIRELNILSNGLLELANANLDISELRLEPLRIDEVVGAARADVLKIDKRYRVNLHFKDYPDDENWLITHGNEQLIKASLVNVIENACKYSEDHSAGIDLAFSPQHILISVRDSGIGISPGDLLLVFEPFYRADHVKNMKGHGIGLTLAKKVTELHKGSIHIQSEAGRGTCVNIRLPHL